MSKNKKPDIIPEHPRKEGEQRKRRKINGISQWVTDSRIVNYPDQRNLVEKQDFVSLRDQVAILVQDYGKIKKSRLYQSIRDEDEIEPLDAHFRLTGVERAERREKLERRLSSVTQLAKKLQKARDEQKPEAVERSDGEGLKGAGHSPAAGAAEAQNDA